MYTQPVGGGFVSLAAAAVLACLLVCISIPTASGTPRPSISIARSHTRMRTSRSTHSGHAVRAARGGGWVVCGPFRSLARNITTTSRSALGRLRLCGSGQLHGVGPDRL
jgi:hypothetical protein